MALGAVLAAVGIAPGVSGAARDPRDAGAQPLLVYTKLALTGGRTASDGVWAMGADGTDPHQLFAFADPGAATVSPAGTEVAIAAAGSDTVSIMTLGGVLADTLAVHDPTGRGIVSLRWSADGSELAYSVIGPSGALVSSVVDIGSGQSYEVADPGGNPSWSPSGTALVVDDVGWYDGSTNGSLRIVRPGQPAARTIVSEPGSAGAPAQPAWSPSGAQIAFDGLDGLEVVGSYGGPVTALHVTGAAPVWFPDSSAIAYAATRNGATVSIFVVRPNGAGAVDVDGANGDYQDTPVGFVDQGATHARGCAQTLPGDVVSLSPTAADDGYLVADGHGDVVACGAARFAGSLIGDSLSAPIVAIVADDETGGYWLVAADGGVFAFDAPFLGSPSTLRLRSPVVGMLASRDDAGYLVVAADGGVFTYGDARFAGALAARPLRAPVVGVSAGAGPSGAGYDLVAADGGVFAFGAPFGGSMAGRPLAAPIVAIAPWASGGYRLIAGDGGAFSFGAPFWGSAAGIGLEQRIVDAAPDGATSGYWLLGADGGVFAFHAPFFGSVAP